MHIYNNKYHLMLLPDQLNYNNQLRTKGFFSMFKQWTVQPCQNGNSFWPGQVVKIQLLGMAQSTVFDPYRTHLEITVSCDIDTLPVGLLQVDNSAQSFINQLIITSKNRQVQRIVQYGILAAYLNDIGIHEIYTEGKQVQGLGHSKIDNYSSLFSSSLSQPSQYTFSEINGDLVSYSNPGTIQPTIPVKYNMLQSWGNWGVSAGLMSGSVRTHINPLNTAWLDITTQNPYWTQFILSDTTQPQFSGTTRLPQQQLFGYNNNVRTQYLLSSRSNDYIETTTSVSKGQLSVDPSVFGSIYPAKKQNNVPYQVYHPQTIPYLYVDQTNNARSSYQIPNTPNLMGWTTLYSPNFAKGVRQPFISPTVPQAQMVNGLILPQKIPITRRTFKIPLISACIGILIPQQNFILIPVKPLNDLLIELTIDPNAMFTSGYNDVGQFDNIGMGLMQKRVFQVERIVYNMHTYQFWNPQVDEFLRVSTSTGVAINSSLWQLANQYQIQNSQSLNNAYPIACIQEVLTDIVILFVPNDYQLYSFCRKHFRISNNITKIQLKINMEYYPSLGYTGNAGTPVAVDTTGDNSVFLQQIYLNDGYMFGLQQLKKNINQYNFAINERCYNIANTNTFYDPAMINNVSYTWGMDSVNADTALGMAHLHENRYVGKAAYLFTFRPFAHSGQYLTGIDTRNSKDFSLILNTLPTPYFQRTQTMYIYTKSSVFYEFSATGGITMGAR